MRSFVAHALLFALIQAVILVGLWRLCPTDADHFMAATIDKHARLRAASSPRVIFVGGSSVGFGVDSREFEALGLAPVNMGLNVGLGLPFMLAEVAPELREGDVVVIAPETHLYWRGSKDDAIWEVLQQRPASVSCVTGAGARELSDQGLHFLARRVRCAAHQISSDRPQGRLYRRQSFDAYGDFSAHRNLPRREEDPVFPRWPEAEALDLDPAIAALADFARDCEAAGARCFMTWSPTRHVRLRAEAEIFAAIESRLRADVPLPVLERPAELGFAHEEFFDHGQHLSGPAAKRRSQQLARRLSSHLSAADR